MDPAILTVGYEGAALRDLLATLQAAGVRHLLDVRALPLSRKPGFSKRGLAASVAELGIGYTHLRALGTPKPGRIAARHGDVVTLERIYAEQLATPEAALALAEAAVLVAAEPTCLLCYEADPACCHRRLIADRLAGGGAPIRHLRIAASV